jgi:hypothetical protein
MGKSYKDLLKGQTITDFESMVAALQELTALITPDGLAVDVEGGISGGNPKSGFEAAGDDDNAYNDIVTAPARECRYLHVATGNGGVRVSIDGGVTVAFYVPANTERAFTGLSIASGTVIKAKKYVDGGTIPTNTAISVW